MAIYDINGNKLSSIYDIYGNELQQVYDTNGNEIYSRVTLSSISVAYSGGTVPAGTTLDQLTGVEVTAIYSDGTIQSVVDYALSGELIPGQENSITVTYQGQTSSFIVTVDPVPKVLTGITVSYSGGNVPSGTTLDQLTGITVTATYSDGTSEVVTDYTLSGTLTAGQDNTVTVTYQGKTATFTVTVEAVVTHNATRTYSAGDMAVTVDDDVDEQIVSIEDGTMAFVVYPDFPAFENPYLECPSSKFPIHISAGGAFKNNDLNGYLNFSGSDKYFCAAHCVTEGTVIKGTGAGGAINSTFDYPGSLYGSGWMYWLSNGSGQYGTIFTCSKKTVIDKLYGVRLTGTDYEDLSQYGARMAEYIGELDLIPGQNFAGRSTGGVVTVYKNGTAIGTNADLSTFTVKAGDVLKCDGGAIVFRVGVNAANPLTEVKWTAAGDSLTDAGINATYKYHFIIKDAIGLTSVPVFGRGSSGYKQLYNSGLSYWQRLAGIPHDADVVTIFGSVNDWHQTPSNGNIGTVTDNLSTGQTNLMAYINSTIDMAQRRAPLAKIILVDELYFGGHNEQYRIEGLKAIGNARNIPVYDFYNDTYEGKGYSDGTNPYCNTYEGMGLNFQQAEDADFKAAYGSGDFHPNNDYNMQWLAPMFATAICNELGYPTTLLPDSLRTDI